MSTSPQKKIQTLYDVVDSINFALLILIFLGISFGILKRQMSLNIIVIYILNFLFFKFFYSKMLNKSILKEKGKLEKVVIGFFLYVLPIILGSILSYLLLTIHVVYVQPLYMTIALVITLIVTTLIRKRLKNSLESQCNP